MLLTLRNSKTKWTSGVDDSRLDSRPNPPRRVCWHAIPPLHDLRHTSIQQRRLSARTKHSTAFGNPSRPQSVADKSARTVEYRSSPAVAFDRHTSAAVCRSQLRASRKVCADWGDVCATVAKKRCTTPTCPQPAARCNGVRPWASVTSKAAPLANKASTMAVWP